MFYKHLSSLRHLLHQTFVSPSHQNCNHKNTNWVSYGKPRPSPVFLLQLKLWHHCIETTLQKTTVKRHHRKLNWVYQKRFQTNSYHLIWMLCIDPTKTFFVVQRSECTTTAVERILRSFTSNNCSTFPSPHVKCVTLVSTSWNCTKQTLHQINWEGDETVVSRHDAMDIYLTRCWLPASTLPF
jgi:hypothetical protein